MNYSKEEILEFVKELKSQKRSHGCWGEVELNPPNTEQVKSAQIIEQLLARKRSGKCKS
jgi:hypothetical protein